MRYIFLVAIAILSIAAPAMAETAVGFKQLELPDDAGARKLNLSLWYPAAASGKSEIVGENAAFYGLEVQSGASFLAGSRPLVLLSHGFGGSWRNLNWIAGELVQQGYVVAAPDHAGESFTEENAAEIVPLWERPRDISRTLTALLDNDQLAGKIDRTRIAVIGHSLGGWTAMELTGARYSADLALKDCKTEKVLPQCKAPRMLGKVGIVNEGKADPRLSMDLSDVRIRAVVALDLGPAAGFLPETLKRVDVPVLVLAAGVETPEIAAIKADSEYIAGHLPKVTTVYREIPDASHFSFMQICKPNGKKIVEELSPGEGFVCRDGGGRDRAAIHRQIAEAIVGFLKVEMH
ncbi:alpha/beta hydrolase family protein [Rhizobium nepotum]|uniref:Dienelactone hydrolase n=1 Tax=Rhizobium nepotum 39/7 TaxID=1368418 RepID=A0ABR5CMV0_9HYPH|nr:alpha/beta fold hydrolase [Rhizobium nepotum]KJF66173.1 dienelactone hydrolase [Rhizobium nepotum 39/7]